MNLGSVARRVQAGETVTFLAVGGSMSPRIESGTEVTVEPFSGQPKKGDVVLARVNKRWVLHLVSATSNNSDRVQISNNHGHVNGWTAASNVVGKLA